ncbi:MAG: WecB/TagA/CpsF family glycosyltransferase [Candidatus Omnitrophica bacterium]|nr:WecB/TagA/CpsF family glycosyltransferase [Candidatus Omnitrophota bacterium]
MIEKKDILGVNIAVTDLPKTCQIILDWVREGRKTYVCIAPVSTIVDCQKDQVYRDIVNKSGITTPDGMPVVWLLKARGHKAVRRTYGPDLMLEVCEAGHKNGLRHYFFGGTDEVNLLLIKNLRKKFPEIKITGSYAPGIRNIGDKEPSNVLKFINDVKPDVLWVGLGSPKQDYWMANHRALLDVPVMVGVGAAFDFVAGTKKQAPKWIRHSGLEWLFRLCSEPKRLWKRYLVGNTVFIWLLICELFNVNKVKR